MRVLQCVAVCCSVLQCVVATFHGKETNESVAVCCSVLQCVAVCCSVLQCVAVCCRVLQCVVATFHGKETNESESADEDWITLPMQ